MNELDLVSALLWGVFATGVLTLIMSASQGFGWSRMSMPFMLGSMFTPRRGPALVSGFVLHLIIGCFFALLYALVFEEWQRANWYLGALLGVYHGAFMLVVAMSVLPSIHPRMASKHHGPTPTRQLEPPGFLALNYGRRTTAATFFAHVVYGLILGAFYHCCG